MLLSGSCSLFQTQCYRPSSHRWGSNQIVMTTTNLVSLPHVMLVAIRYHHSRIEEKDEDSLFSSSSVNPSCMLHYIGQIDGWRDESSYRYCFAYCFFKGWCLYFNSDRVIFILFFSISFSPITYVLFFILIQWKFIIGCSPATLKKYCCSYRCICLWFCFEQ
jgi:hypothetical protein